MIMEEREEVVDNLVPVGDVEGGQEVVEKAVNAASLKHQDTQ